MNDWRDEAGSSGKGLTLRPSLGSLILAGSVPDASGKCLASFVSLQVSRAAMPPISRGFSGERFAKPHPIMMPNLSAIRRSSEGVIIMPAGRSLAG